MTKAISRESDHLRLQVQVQPRGSKNQWGQLVIIDSQEWLQLKITSPPVDGAANKACIKLIAKTFRTAKSRVELVQGEKSRFKTFMIRGVDEAVLTAFLKQLHLT